MQQKNVIIGILVGIAVIGSVIFYMNFTPSSSTPEPKVNVKAKNGFLTYSDGSVSEDAFLIITAMNVGNESVVLSSVSVLAPGDLEVPFPYTLEPGCRSIHSQDRGAPEDPKPGT